ncbi:MAG TPA: class I SAM-dependent methyltransferase [Anaerolineaceae bacterium]|nr:class I SAM-dependent methyltransferase [Anaerolineaceae bacterium]
MTDPWNQFWTTDSELAWWKRPAPEVEALIAALSPAAYPRALDLGCGLGRHSIALAAAGFRVTALDSSAEAVRHLQEWAAALGLTVAACTGSYLDVLAPAGSLDLVISYNVIYHGTRAQFARAIQNVQAALRPGGLFFFTCPTRRDGKYGFGEEIEPHAWRCARSMIPGDLHYFADEADLDALLAGFHRLERRVDEGEWDNNGRQQFFSNWQVLVEKL